MITKIKACGNVSPWAAVDAALEIDLKDGKTRAGFGVMMAGACVSFQCVTKMAFSAPGAEYVQTRNCAVEIRWIRNLMTEIGFASIVED